MFSNYKITANDIYSVIKAELNINKKFEEVSNCTFQELRIQSFEVNSTLNKLEWIYGLSLKDDGISLQTKVIEFINIILVQV